MLDYEQSLFINVRVKTGDEARRGAKKSSPISLHARRTRKLIGTARRLRECLQIKPQGGNKEKSARRENAELTSQHFKFCRKILFQRAVI